MRSTGLHRAPGIILRRGFICWARMEGGNVMKSAMVAISVALAAGMMLALDTAPAASCTPGQPCNGMSGGTVRPPKSGGFSWKGDPNAWGRAARAEWKRAGGMAAVPGWRRFTGGPPDDGQITPAQTRALQRAQRAYQIQNEINNQARSGAMEFGFGLVGNR